MMTFQLEQSKANDTTRISFNAQQKQFAQDIANCESLNSLAEILISAPELTSQVFGERDDSSDATLEYCLHNLNEVFSKPSKAKETAEFDLTKLSFVDTYGYAKKLKILASAQYEAHKKAGKELAETIKTAPTVPEIARALLNHPYELINLERGERIDSIELMKVLEKINKKPYLLNNPHDEGVSDQDNMITKSYGIRENLHRLLDKHIFPSCDDVGKALAKREMSTRLPALQNFLNSQEDEHIEEHLTNVFSSKFRCGYY